MMAELTLSVRARTTGTAALADIASSAVSSQVIARLFTLVFSILAWRTHSYSFTRV
jgi:hypothetical protein